jgi:hypothetical protein
MQANPKRDTGRLIASPSSEQSGPRTGGLPAVTHDPELAREIGSRGALTRAVLELIGLEMLENHGSAVRPTKVIARFERLRLP